MGKLNEIHRKKLRNLLKEFLRFLRKFVVDFCAAWNDYLASKKNDFNKIDDMNINKKSLFIYPRN